MSIGKSGIIKQLKFHSVRPNVGGIGNVNLGNEVRPINVRMSTMKPKLFGIQIG